MGWVKSLYQRYLFARHLPRRWRLRPRTLDARIVRAVVLENEYRLPQRFAEPDVILDIGAHIGSFALAALTRGAGVVYCFEPDADNFALLEHNLAPFGDRVRLRRAAVWRSDVPAATLSLHNPIAARNTGAHQVAEGDGVPAIALDEILGELGPIRLAKLDCEGAEWPILFTSRRLGQIRALCGEYHLGPLPAAFRVGDEAFSTERLAQLLSERGFAARTEPLPPLPHPCGLFFAEAKAQSASQSSTSPL